MMHWGWFGGGGWWLLAGLVGFVTLLAVVAVVIWAVSRTGSARAPRRVESAYEAAQRRYAAGEITREEYLRIKEDLS
jgi:putative membrane protein